jgi:hypothetical protein
MLLDSIGGVEKVVEGRSLYTLWTKYGKWESEGPSLFEERAVQREIGPGQASPGIDVPASYFVLKLSEEDRSALALGVSSILIRDEYRQALDDICYFATHNDLPPLQQDRAYSAELVSSATLVGICDYTYCRHDQGKGFGNLSCSYFESSQDIQLSTTSNPISFMSLTRMAYMKWTLDTKDYSQSARDFMTPSQQNTGVWSTATGVSWMYPRSCHTYVLSLYNQDHFVWARMAKEI